MKRIFRVERTAIIVSILLLCFNVYSQNRTKNRIYEVWENSPAPNRGGDYSQIMAGGYPYDSDWEKYSYPIGNGYMGANIFGRTDVERIQITEKTLANEGLYGLGGITDFAELYLEFNHYKPQDYKRSLVLNEGIMYVDYNYEGVQYNREYFANYPDHVIVVRLSSNEKNKISFTLSTDIPYLRSNNEINTRTGKTIAENDLITLSGSIPYFNINYECQVKVLHDGGKLISENESGESTIRVEEANTVILIIAAGTNYELSHKIFLEDTPEKKLDGSIFPHEKISGIINHAAELGYLKLKENHLNDYQNLFSRVHLVISPDTQEIPTQTLIENYQNDTTQTYLEELMFHFGRYLLISSSRKGTLPAGLQGVWSQYAVTPWTGGYWHNINVQMNYWGAFSSNLAETFIPYIEYYQAYLPKATLIATQYVQKNNPEKLEKEKGSNGWIIGTGATAYNIGAPGGHSGPGTGGFTSKLFWDYYDFTRDSSYLRKTGYPAILGMSLFLSKTLKPFENRLLLVEPSASPEQIDNGKYYVTKGTTFDQGFVWETYHDLLKAAKVVDAQDDFIDTIKNQIDHLNPILIGQSGQVKEFREEHTYGEIGEKHHRHVSHLCPLYPGTLINTDKSEWIQGVIKSLDLRGNKTTGWAMAHRMNLRARTREAEKAHEVYSLFIRERTLPNLWTTHPPFQIDGNLGVMAGVAEMLLQSHEGCIEPLPALPKVWANGEYSGLVARGNFELSAKWENGQASYFKVIAKSGGECVIRYKNIGNAQVKNDSGLPISHKREDSDKISFKTEKSRKYLITFGKEYE